MHLEERPTCGYLHRFFRATAISHQLNMQRSPLQIWAANKH
jgi:hypothetical protein